MHQPAAGWCGGRRPRQDAPDHRSRYGIKGRVPRDCERCEAERIFGYTPREILGRHFSIFFEPSQANQLNGYLKEAPARGRYETDRWFPRSDGETFYGTVVIRPLRAARPK